jgi:hypothetical protein
MIPTNKTNLVVVVLVGVILKARCRRMIDKAIKFFENEIRSLELAPELNGCEMTEEWQEQMEIFKTSKSALEKQIPKKPEISRSTIGVMWGKKIKTKHFACPFCKSIFLFAKDEVKGNCCKFCGQALDFGGDTE